MLMRETDLILCDQVFCDQVYPGRQETSLFSFQSLGLPHNTARGRSEEFTTPRAWAVISVKVGYGNLWHEEPCDHEEEYSWGSWCLEAIVHFIVARHEVLLRHLETVIQIVRKDTSHGGCHDHQRKEALRQLRQARRNLRRLAKTVDLTGATLDEALERAQELYASCEPSYCPQERVKLVLCKRK